MLQQSLIESLNESRDHIALLDKQGTIVFVNRAWKEFARANGYTGGPFDGQNYVQICQQGIANKAIGADVAFKLVQDSLDGIEAVRQLKMGCHAPRQLRWFTCVASQFSHTGNTATVMISWRDTSRQHLAGLENRSFGHCSVCNLELPLLMPEPAEIPQSWECTFCGNRYQAVLDECKYQQYSANVLRLEE